MSRPAAAEPRRFNWPKEGRLCPVDRALRETIGDVSWAQCRRMIETGKVTINGETVVDNTAVVSPGDEIIVNPNASRPSRREMPKVDLVYFDAQIVVANKPSGISTVPFDSSERGTFDELVHRALERSFDRRTPPLGIVHRIDKETSGLVVFARTLSAKRHLKQQFRFHTNHRAYLALALGRVGDGKIQTRLVSDRGDGRRGSTTNSRIGQIATTYVEVLEYFREATLIRCRLETGRTHQIRIHMAELGHPLLGERIYGSSISSSQQVAPRLMLHAAELGIAHPVDNKRLDFRSEAPHDFLSIVEGMRRYESAGTTTR